MSNRDNPHLRALAELERKRSEAMTLNEDDVVAWTFNGQRISCTVLIARLMLAAAHHDWSDERIEQELLVGIEAEGQVWRRRPWIWAKIGHQQRRRQTRGHGYEPTREAAMAALAKSWRGGWSRGMGRAMNWRRRLLRLWLVLSLCWIAGVGVYAWKQEPGISSSQFGYEIASSPEQQNEKEIVGSMNAELAKRYAAYVLLPPLTTLALVLLGAWVVSNFERRGA
jgi:hypothetical protein